MGFTYCSGGRASKKEAQVNYFGGNVTTGEARASPGNPFVFSRACYHLYTHERMPTFGQGVEGLCGGFCGCSGGRL